MIDSKFALKYPMPHSVVHIVDNSGAINDANYTEANDPSLLGTLVVTGAPMGEDNKIITLTRSDVASVSFGLGAITPYDIKKYGQGVTYVQDLINQNVPVKFMRITPPDSTYAVVSMVVQWREEGTDDKIHVRFMLKDWPETLARENFKNTSKLNDALNNAFKSDSVVDGMGIQWKQRGFINFIAAGRGGEYNNMATAINIVSQAKRPANVRYQFITFDTRTNAVVETFYASLMNQKVGNTRNPNGLDSVNTIVSKRVQGSSIIVPYLNESAVTDIYNDYMAKFRSMITSGQADDFANDVYKAMNINIFDLIFGNYIYNGTETDTKMPYYQVDMVTSDIPKLDKSRILCDVVENKTSTWDRKYPNVLFEKLKDFTVGVKKENSDLYVGDIILVPSSAQNGSPKLTLVTAINQYTGNVTSMTIPKVYPLKAVEKTSENESGEPVTEYVWEELDVADENGNSKSIKITKCVTDLDETTLRSKTIEDDVKNRNIENQGVVAAVFSDDAAHYHLYTVEVTETTSDNNGIVRDYVLHEYPKNLMYKALDRFSHSGGTVGTGNAFGFDENDAAWNRVGAAKVVYDEKGVPSVCVNGYNYRKSSSADEGMDDVIVVTRAATNKYDVMRQTVSDITNLSGENFDVKVYEDVNIDSWKITSLSIVSPGTKYVVGDKVWVDIGIEDDNQTTAKTILTVTEVDDNGGVVSFTMTNDAYLKSQKTAFAAKSMNKFTTKLILPEDPETHVIPEPDPDTQGTGLEVYMKSFWVEDGNAPREIYRYVVSGSYGSLSTILNTYLNVPSNYYNDAYGINPTTEHGGMRLSGGNAGFFDDDSISSIEYKWKYSALLVDALRGGDNFDKRILSPTRVPAKFMFDAGYNTLYGSTIVTNITAYQPADLINSSIIFTEEEKDEILFNPDTLSNIKQAADIDVKQAMYDLMIHRCYDGIPEDKRPIGPGSGFQVHFDSGVTDSQTTTLVRESFLKRFDNPNASWDIGGFTDLETGISYTFTKHLVEDMFRHIQATSINKPYAGTTTAIPRNRYTSFFPDLDATDWGKREQLYLSGGNAWILQRDGSLQRRSQRTLLRDSETSDLLQENNMRTLSRLVFLLQDKIDSYLLEYNSDSVIKSLQDEVNNMFSNWIGNLVDGLDIQFERDKNIDGGDILVCYCNVVFRGLILRVPIIVNVNQRTN